jgi:hypothetical protein
MTEQPSGEEKSGCRSTTDRGYVVQKGITDRNTSLRGDTLETYNPWDKPALYRAHCHKAKLADGISDGIVRSAFLKLELHQRVKTPGDY